MKTKLKIISVLLCVPLIVGLVTLIIGAAIGNDDLVNISMFSTLGIYIVFGLPLKIFGMYYDLIEKTLKLLKK